MLEMRAFGKAYAQQMVANAVALGSEMESRGFTFLQPGGTPTSSNTLLIEHAGGVDAYLACETLFRCGMSANAQPFNGHAVLRLGTQEVTRRGVDEHGMQWIADILHRALVLREPTAPIRREVAAFMRCHQNVHYSFDEALGFWD